MNPTGDGPRKQTRSGRTPAPPAALTVAAWFAFAPAIWASTKTDVLLFKNGDHLTCEVKELRSGQLQVKTDALSTVSVDWDKVVRLTTVRMHEVQVSSGDTYYGPLEASTRDGYLVVRTSDGPRELELWDVVHMRPLRASFWNRIDGSLDVGGSYTHASRLLQFTPSLDTTYAARAFTLNFDFDWTLTRQEEEEDTERLDATIRYGRSFARRFVAFGEVTAQRNSELGLDWRTELAGGVGRIPGRHQPQPADGRRGARGKPRALDRRHQHHQPRRPAARQVASLLLQLPEDRPERLLGLLPEPQRPRPSAR